MKSDTQKKPKTFRIDRAVVRTILKDFKEQLALQRRGAKDVFHLRAIEYLARLNEKVFADVLEKLFYATLSEEEGRTHFFSVIISPPESVFQDLVASYTRKYNVGYFDDVSTFERPIDLTSLSKIAPAFETSDRLLRVWIDDEGKPHLWGFAKGYFQNTGIEIRMFSPGQLLIYVFSSDYPRVKFLMNFSRTERIGSDFSLIKLFATSREIRETRCTSDRVTWLRSHDSIRRRHALFVDLINKIHQHEHGGTLLVLPGDSSDNILTESIKDPIPYRPQPRYDFLKRMLGIENEDYVKTQTSDYSNRDFRRSFEEDINYLGQLTSVDGATIITNQFELIGFGAKIKPKESGSLPAAIWIKEPLEKFREHSKDITDIGGTRHQSAAQFISDQRAVNVFAIVASQDGQVSVMYWDAIKSMVVQFRHAEYLFFGIRL